MSVEIATNEYPITITRRRARQFDIQLRYDIPYASYTSRNLIEYITSPIYKRKHCIRSVVVENNNTDKRECNICYEECEKRCFVKLNCRHEFCGKCTKITLENTSPAKNPRCAYCRTGITDIEFPSEEVKAEFSDILMTTDTSC
jgi:hypothetical protein